MKRVLVLFVVGVVLFGACSAQSANAQNTNIAQRIIGTWVDNEGTTWVFNANGNLTWGSIERKFAVIDTQLAITNTDGRNLWMCNISMSSDGRTLFLVLPANESYNRWLTKR